MKKQRWIYIALAVALPLVCAVSLAVGNARLSPSELWAGLFRHAGAETASAILYAIRLPRLLAALIAGAGLSLSGVLLQSVMGNDLASPNTVGVNAGAGLFTVLCLALFPALTPFLPLAAFMGAMLTILLVMSLSRLMGGTSSLSVILAGIACTALFQAGISFFNVVDSDTLIAYNAFSAGSFSGVAMRDLPLPAVLVAVSFIISLSLSGRISALTLGAPVASSLGIRVSRLRALCLVLAGLCAAAVVSYAGLLGFVGLVAPHITRKLVGHPIRHRLIAAPLVGALIVTLSDLAARTLFAPAELPVGILMAFVGAPFLLAHILGKKRKEDERA